MICDFVLKSKDFNCVKMAKEVEKDFEKKVTAQTMRNCLKFAEIFAYAFTQKPLLSKKHKSRRMELCSNWNMRPKTFWENVLFSDKCKFNLFNSDRRRFFGERVIQNTIIKILPIR